MNVLTEYVPITTKGRNDIVDITGKVTEALRTTQLSVGTVTVFVSGSTALSTFASAEASVFGSAVAGRGWTLKVASSGCEKLAGVTSPGVMITRAPIFVQFHILTAKDIGMRMQPCEAGWPGRTPAWMAMPDQVIRCIKGIGAPL